MLTIYLLRHGETVWNADGNRYCGATDVELTEKGLLQAENARKLLAGIPFDAICSSTLQRAFLTASIASGGKDVVRDKRIMEAAFGEWEGKTRAEFIRADPASWEEWQADPGMTRAGRTGETALEVVARVDHFFNEMGQLYPQGTILVVAHNTVNRLYLCHKLGMPLRNYRRIVQENSSITRFTLDDQGEIALHQLNCR